MSDPKHATDVTIAHIDLHDEHLLRRAYRLQKRAYAEEARLIGFDRLPPLLETLEGLRACNERFIGAYCEGRLVGALAFMQSGTVVDTHRLFVEPETWRRYIATQLLDHVHAIPHVTQWRVSTADLNVPAKALYRSTGYVECGRTEKDGLCIVHFVRMSVR
jgi:GNAT superfamily N-acetyltransferase